MLGTRLFGSPKGKAPRPWDHTLYTDQTDPHRPISVTREDELFRRLKLSQRLMVGVVIAVLLAGVNQWRMTSKIQPQTRLWVVEIEDGQHVRGAGMLPQQPYNYPLEGEMVFVIRYWLWNLRNVGDSEVLLGQAWKWTQMFTDEKLIPWFRQQVDERHAIYKQGKTVQITQPIVLPLHKNNRVFKVSWEEITYERSGEPNKPKKWEATFTMKVNPPKTIQEQRLWRNDLGIVVNEIHWLQLN